MSADNGPRTPRAESSDENATGVGLIAALFRELLRLILQHVTLAGAELAESGAALGMASVLAIAALMTGFAAIMLLLVAAALALAVTIPIWLAFFLVAAGALLGAAGLWLLARAYARRCSLVPHRAVASLHRQLTEIGEQLR
jgi:uncharacterized membrane protein YqjE